MPLLLTDCGLKQGPSAARPSGGYAASMRIPPGNLKVIPLWFSIRETMRVRVVDIGREGNARANCERARGMMVLGRDRSRCGRGLLGTSTMNEKELFNACTQLALFRSERQRVRRQPEWK